MSTPAVGAAKPDAPPTRPDADALPVAAPEDSLAGEEHPGAALDLPLGNFPPPIKRP